MENQKKSLFESPIFRSKIRSNSVSLFPEAGLGYLLGPLLAIVGNGVVNMWLIQYWDKVLMLGTWNPLFETLLPIISAVIIIIGNLVVGRLMERKPTLAGKARPLILLGMPCIAVALLVLFIVPLPVSAGGEFSDLLASILIAVGYNLYYAFAWPLYYTSHSALVNLSTRDGGKRGLLSTCIMAAQLGASGVSGMAGGLLVDLLGLLPKYQYGISAEGKPLTTNIYADALNKVGGDKGLVTELISPADANSKWKILMIIMICALVVGCLLEYFFTRERITEENIKHAAASNSENKESKTKVSMGEQIKICTHDKYWWLIIIFFFLYQFGGQMKNNAMSFYSQAMVGGTSLASLINTLGAIPTAVGMALVWPIARKITKSKTITLGCVLAFLGSLISFVALIPGLDTVAISGIAVGSFMVKALGTAPAMYISLALLANVLDHQEAIHGKRTDGFTMAVYGSIMVCMAGVCNGIIAGINSLVTDIATRRIVNTILGYGVEGVCYLIMGIMFIAMNVEKFTKLDNIAIRHDHKVECEKEGREWIAPEVKAEMEEKENERLVEEVRVQDLKVLCEKKGLDFETENNKYLADKAEKDKVALAKKEAAEQKKAEAKRKEQERFDALPQEKKDAIKQKEELIVKEFNEIRLRNNREEVSFAQYID